MDAKLSKTHWGRIESVLDDVIDHEPDQQSALVKSLCGGDKDLYRDVCQLLHAGNVTAEYLDQPAIALANGANENTHTPSDFDKPQFQGIQLGAYTVRNVIGRGGMGTVYLGERKYGNSKQQVAIKLLSAEKGNRLFLQRFKQEQQLLASLVHPNIAQIYDSGSFDGRPYFVMEYVRGISIDQYCLLKRLSTEQRLEILRQVADILNFAHRHLVVHRDIKPSNILVSEEGHIKLLDFGIAKLLSTDGQSQLTCTGEQLLTPGYAAPEQLQNRNITVATDVYQLGLLAYRLLTGQDAFDGKFNSLADMVRIICEEQPQAPSTRARSALSELATNKDEKAGAEPSGPCPIPYKELKGDIDAIILKMLANDPSDRYFSMEALVYDIEAYLNKRPVAAANSNTLYKARKFIQRHWRPLIVGASFTSLLIVYAVNSHYQRKATEMALEESHIAQEKAKQVSDFLIGVFKSADPFNQGADKTSARQLLDQGERKVEPMLSGSPDVGAHMLKVLGEINISIGDEQKSVDLLEKALELHERENAEDTREKADILLLLGTAYEMIDEFEESLRVLSESMAIYTKLEHRHGQDHLIKRAQAMNDSAIALYRMGKREEAKATSETVLRKLAERELKITREYAIALNTISVIEYRRGNFFKAIDQMYEAIAINREILGDNHPKLGRSLKNLAVKLRDMERYSEAESIFIEVFDIQNSNLPKDHPDTLRTRRDLAVLYHRQGRLKQARTELGDILVAQQGMQTKNSLEVSITKLRLANILTEVKDYSAAEDLLNSVSETFRGRPVRNSLTFRLLYARANLLHETGQLHEAVDHYHRALTLLPSENMRRSSLQLDYALTLLKLKQYPSAERLARKALNYRLEKLPNNNNFVAEATAVVGLSLLGQGEEEKANTMLSEARRILVTGRKKGDKYREMVLAPII